jgi:hypothetical protein
LNFYQNEKGRRIFWKEIEDRVKLPYSSKFFQGKKKGEKDKALTKRGFFQGVELFESIIQSGGIKHQKLNIDRKPIANKYRKGKIKSTLKKE